MMIVNIDFIASFFDIEKNIYRGIRGNAVIYIFSECIEMI